MSIEENKTYEDKMLEAFIQNPKKFEYYKNAFAKYEKFGIERFAWNWSWWGFFGTVFFLLYRKTYLYAVAIWIILLLVGILNSFAMSIFDIENATAMSYLISLPINIVIGGSSIYFIFKKYKKSKLEIENKIQDESERIEAMYSLGGVNKWVIWLTYISLGLCVVLIILTIIGMSQKDSYSIKEKNDFVTGCINSNSDRYQVCSCVFDVITQSADHSTYLAANKQYAQKIDGRELQQINNIIDSAIAKCSK